MSQKSIESIRLFDVLAQESLWIQVKFVPFWKNKNRLDKFKWIWFNYSSTDAIIADPDAVLLLENIKFQNYINEDRCIGFDNDATMAILKVLFNVKIWIWTLIGQINKFIQFIDTGTIPCTLHRHQTYTTGNIWLQNQTIFESGQFESRWYWHQNDWCKTYIRLFYKTNLIVKSYFKHFHFLW